MNTFFHSREIDAPIEHVFAAISNPERLARWWGPDGFTNTFIVCDFKVSGQWLYTMHGPDGKKYPNKSIFTEIELNKKVTIHHESLPKYDLTITFEKLHSSKKTLVSWSQSFEKPEVAKAIAHIVAPANEQNLNRLEFEAIDSYVVHQAKS